MAITILKEFEVTMRDGESFKIYSERNLADLDSILRYCVKIEPTGCAGLGYDDTSTHDDVPYTRLCGRRPGTSPIRVKKGTSLAETLRILEAHRRAKKGE